jgi:hypothetical protein
VIAVGLRPTPPGITDPVSLLRFLFDLIDAFDESLLALDDDAT